MNDTAVQQIQEILELAETAHGAWAVYQGGKDDNWAGFYASFIVRQSPVADALGKVPALDQTVVALRELARAHREGKETEPWPQWYAARFADALARAGRS
jgi:hypothetical protein